MPNIDVNKSIALLLAEHSQLAGILAARGIDCPHCLAAEVDTLSDVARKYGLNLSDILRQLGADMRPK
ncbi:MAG: hypothetical protein H7831_02415 [Magnetococcus sp. WYHC-3]